MNPASGGAVSVRLVAFVDYGNENLQDDDVILLRVGNLYLQYNRAKGYNIDTPNSYADHVTITKANSNADVSTLVGSITTGRSYIYDDGSDKVVIQVCNQVASSLGYDYSLLSIHLADGSQASLCSGFADIPSDGASIVPGNQDDWIVDDADPLVFESDKSENNPSATNGLLVGIIWGFVGLLFSVAVFLLYKMRRARQQHQTRPLSPPARQGSSRQRKSSRSSSRKSGRPRKTDDKESPEKAAPRKKMLEPCRTREESFSSDSTGELEHEITVESDLSFEEIVVEVDDESQIESKKELPSDA